ncbi:hypothetical protein [Halorussus sp. MSC15.2]|uniref:hypothetical protein n=1 Tax=Halorussus sp. MSC15.2 TaxID=2283638 RepID=UPI0013D2F797|nr:hypothetical protein [Halorussus sp. MSC15.2]NEU57105.1 hypothetical protein [Halorussus sp. MSC15.2]
MSHHATESRDEEQDSDDGNEDAADRTDHPKEQIKRAKRDRRQSESETDASDTLSWDEAASGFERQLEQRRTVGVEIPEMGVAEFTLRGLSREERDEVEQKAANVNRKGRRDTEVEVDTGAIRQTMLKYGIVSGPEGFKPQREDHLDALPPGVQDELVDIVEDMSTLSVEERDGFQEMG